MGSSGSISVLTHHPSGNSLVNTLMLNNVNLQTSKGISITGNLTEYNKSDNTIQTSGYGLIATNGIKASKFTGNGAEVTNTADGNSTTGSSASISGWSSSGTASFAVVTLTNGRPSFSTRSISVSIPAKPTLSDLGGVTESRVNQLISNALQDYVKKENAVGGILLSGTGSPGEISYGWNTVSGSYVSGGTAHVTIPQNNSGN